MYLPNSYLAAVLLIVFSVLCWGSWANLLKAAGNWRFELFYYDFAFGALVCAVVAAFTLGTLNSAELTFQDNFLIAGYRNMAYALGAGMVFNFGNMLLTAAISTSGMAVAFPIAIGLALAADSVMSYLIGARGDLIPLAFGAVLVLAASVLAAGAHSAHLNAQRAAALSAKPPRRVPKSGKSIWLAVAAAIPLAGFYPLLRFGAWSDSAIGPYGTALLFGAGVCLSTLLLNPFFMYFPIQGKPIEIKLYFTGGKREHFLGLLAGIVWMAGALSAFAAANSASAVESGLAASYEMAQIAALLSALWGLFAWREFRGSKVGVKGLLTGVFLCFGVGLAAMVYGGYAK